MHANGHAGFEEPHRSGRVREVARLTHVRRKVVDVHRAQGSSIAEEAIARIGQLHAVGKAIRGSSPGERTRVRREQAAPIFDDLESWFATQLPSPSGKTPLAAAIRHVRPRLGPYFTIGRPGIDNNAAERAMRGAALGRRN